MKLGACKNLAQFMRPKTGEQANDASRDRGDGLSPREAFGSEDGLRGARSANHSSNKTNVVLWDSSSFYFSF
jgi:hypothetical protein